MRTIFKIIISIFFFLVCSNIYSQSQSATIHGKVIDGNMPIAYANILVLTSDSTYIDGAITNEDGIFSLSGIPYGSKILKISYIGYENLIKNFELNSVKYDVGTVSLNNSSLQLGEVTVTATRPIFRLKEGALVTDVPNSLLGSLGTASDVLDKIPGVSINDDKINVFGKGIPLIYINNRQIYDNSELDQLISSDIQTIEVIRNPGAKYNAENKSVIIIKTKRKNTGLSVNVFERLRIGKYLGNRSLVNIISEHKSVNYSLSYNNSYLKTKTKEGSEYNINTDTIWRQSIDIPYIYKDLQHDLSGSFEWDISKRHSLGLQYRGTFTSMNSNLNGEEDLYADQIKLENIQTESLKKDTPEIHIINTFYNGYLNDKFSYQVNFDYVKKQTTSTQFTEEISDIEANSRRLNIHSFSDFKLIAGKFVGQYSISEDSKLGFGLEYNTIRGKGHYKNDENYLNSNIYTNDEDKFASFVDYQISIKDYNIGLGLRYEHSKEKSTEDSTRIVRVNKTNNNIYPNFNISKTFGDVDLSLNANRRIRRPSFNELNDNNLYVNRFITQKGNPYLKNEYYYEVDFGVYYKFLNFNLGYKYVNNPINIEFQEAGGSSSNSILTYRNYDKYQNLSLMGTFNYSLGIWKPQITIGYTQPFFTTNYNGIKERRNKEGLSIDITNDFVLPKDFVISLYFNYESANDDYITRYASYKQLDIRLRKSFINKSLITSFYASDIFKLKKEGNHSYIGNYDFRIDRYRETRYVTFSIQYLFNKSSKKYRGEGALDDLNRL